VETAAEVILNIEKCNSQPFTLSEGATCGGAYEAALQTYRLSWPRLVVGSHLQPGAPLDEFFLVAQSLAVERLILKEWSTIDRGSFEEMTGDSRAPAVLRGFVKDWPVVDAAHNSASRLADYLKGLDVGQSVGVLLGAPSIGGRFFYDDDMRGFNFQKHEIPFRQVIDKLLSISGDAEPMAIYAGSVGAAGLVPDFAAQNPMPLLDPQIEPRLWLGNQSRIAAHYDIANNIACSVSGKRRFTLFPPDQIGNLYIGPLDFNMAGQPASMVDFANPDFDRYPKFRKALAAAHVVDLEPGDALFIPALWWHHVEAFGPFNLLVNYWWPGPGDGPAFESLVLALLGLRERNPAEKAAWRAYFDHYVFGQDAASAADHLPDHAKTVLGPPSQGRTQKMLSFVKGRLSQRQE
jgi:Cupin-like domain